MTILLTGLSAAEDNYQPLTYEEAVAYLKGATVDEVAADIIKLDYIEHAQAVLTFPARIILLEGRDLHIFYEGDLRYITLEVKPFLKYRAKLEDEVIKKFITGQTLDRLKWLAGGILIGAGITWLVK